MLRPRLGIRRPPVRSGVTHRASPGSAETPGANGALGVMRMGWHEDGRKQRHGGAGSLRNGDGPVLALSAPFVFLPPPFPRTTVTNWAGRKTGGGWRQGGTTVEPRMRHGSVPQTTPADAIGVRPCLHRFGSFNFHHGPVRSSRRSGRGREDDVRPRPGKRGQGREFSFCADKTAARWLLACAQSIWRSIASLSSTGHLRLARNCNTR